MRGTGDLVNRLCPLNSTPYSTSLILHALLFGLMVFA